MGVGNFHVPRSEPIPVLVFPKKPFLDWLHGADPTSLTLTLEDVSEPTIYLLPECDDE